MAGWLAGRRQLPAVTGAFLFQHTFFIFISADGYQMLDYEIIFF